METIPLLQVGETYTTPKGAVVRRLHHSYSLHVVGNNTHCRFGTREEILSDLATYELTGSLPHAKAPSWL